MRSGRNQSVTESRVSKIHTRKPPPMATEMATRAITTATTSSAVAHFGSFTRLILSSAERFLFDANARDHQPAEYQQRQDARDRRPDDHGDAHHLAHHREIVGMRHELVRPRGYQGLARNDQDAVTPFRSQR